MRNGLTAETFRFKIRIFRFTFFRALHFESFTVQMLGSRILSERISHTTSHQICFCLACCRTTQKVNKSNIWNDLPYTIPYRQRNVMKKIKYCFALATIFHFSFYYSFLSLRFALFPFRIGCAGVSIY